MKNPQKIFWGGVQYKICTKLQHFVCKIPKIWGHLPTPDLHQHRSYAFVIR